VALTQTQYLNLENEYVPWSAANSVLSYISLMLSSTPAAESVSAYIVDKLSHVYDTLGYKEKDTDGFKVHI